MKKRFLPKGRGRHAGFSLVEIMVALVIGMLGVIVMMQVFAIAEGQKRSTTATGDAQSNGAMAIYALQRDIRQGGHGFSSDKTLGCALALPVHTLDQLAPVVINPPVADVPAGDANTDTLLIAYGSGAGAPEGDTVNSAPTAAGVMGVQSPTNFAVGDQVIAALTVCANSEPSLTLATVTAVTQATVTVAASGAVENGSLFNLGATPHILAYAVRSGTLTVCDYMASDCSVAANQVPIASNIVSLRAEYGRASTKNSGVDTWDQTMPANACDWTRVKALRIAVVARNSEFDKDVLTAAAPVWEGSVSAVPVPIILSDNWQNYRYKLFETTIPIRNLQWTVTC